MVCGDNTAGNLKNAMPQSFYFETFFLSCLQFLPNVFLTGPILHSQVSASGTFGGCL